MVYYARLKKRRKMMKYIRRRKMMKYIRSIAIRTRMMQQVS